MAKPFFKYLGGKRHLLNIISEKIQEIKNIDTFYEPFVGAGAVFLDYIIKNPGKKVVINDINKNISSAYINIRDSKDDVIQSLTDRFNIFLRKKTDEKKKEYFYQVRESFWQDFIRKGDYGPSNTSTFLFLNKTCYRGVYRENSEGKFNVPYGDLLAKGAKKIDALINFANFNDLSKILQNVEVRNENFKDIFKCAKKNDFYYLDPPYFEINLGKSFSKYDKSSFGICEQFELRGCLELIHKYNAKFLLSNRFEEGFLKNLFTYRYQRDDFDYQIVESTHAISNKKKKKVDEILIYNY